MDENVFNYIFVNKFKNDEKYLGNILCKCNTHIQTTFDNQDLDESYYIDISELNGGDELQYKMKDFKTTKSGKNNPQVNALGKIELFQFDPCTKADLLVGNITG